MANCLVCRVSARSFQSRDNGITFHRFPATRSVICARWKKFAGLAEDYNVKSKRLCSRHFRADDFVNKSPFRKNLRCGAVPTLCHPTNTPSEESELACAPAPLEDVLNGSEDPSNNDAMLDSILSETSESNDEFVSQSNNTLESHIDTAIMDHDYIASATLRKSNHLDHPEDNNKSSNQLLLDDVRKELCRLCGQKGTVLAPIFVLPSLNEEVSISSKIEMYLPFKVKRQDPLPTHICLNCCETVHRWHELYVTSVAANAVLWKTFGGEFNEETSNDADDAIISVNEEIQENEASKNSEFVADIEEEPSVPAKCEEPEENADIICAECKKNKTEIKILEQKEWDEFNKNFVTVRDYSYKCRFCYELFKNSEDRKNHMAMCRQLPTICELCGQKVLCRKDLRRHINLRHLKVVASCRYVCDVCGKLFKSQSYLKLHKMRHVNPISKTSPKYYCEHCCSVFLNEKSYRLHKERHAEGKIKSLFQIKTFQPGEDSKGSVSISVYTCPVCQDVFNDMLSLVIHLTTKRAMKCSLCRKAIPCEKRLLLHVCGEWTCQYCGKTFNNRQKWIEHERIHTGERPIKCRICDKSFRSWPARKIHENRHNPRVYECNYCAKTFKNKYKFQDHVACHEGAEFLCGICNKNFCGRKSLWKHRRTIHKAARETTS
ncbi:hypothetical protein R5R35_001275 [Gryllus longicercus]|uniref:Zinc finger protein n=1 Tax=Gryllus longicercus TaxID=2509291 RepID=A0AAN9Z7P1_9ORTH